MALSEMSQPPASCLLKPKDNDEILPSIPQQKSRPALIDNDKCEVKVMAESVGFKFSHIFDVM